jgi:hypothetical protein
VDASYRAWFREIAAELRGSADELTARQLTVLKKFRAYDKVPVEDLRRSSRRNVLRVVSMLNGDDALPADALEDERASGTQRTLQGIPGEDVLAAYRGVMGVVRDAFIEVATAREVPFDAILVGTRLLWELTDRLSDVLVSARHQVELDVALREERQRQAFLQRVLTGNLAAPEIVQAGPGFGLASNGRYWVFRARQFDGNLPGLSRQLERSAAGTTFAPLVGAIDGDLAGIAVERPAVADDESLVAVIGPTNLTGLSQAFSEATRVLNVAARYRRRGLVDSAALSIRIAVVEEDELGEALYERYVVKVLAASAMADAILDSVRVYLSARRRIQLAAETLSIHQNTLRYRLEQFASLTGADLAETETIIEVWWALEFWAVRRTADGQT